MIWTQCTDYAIKSGKWTISKQIVNRKNIYSLWDGNMHVKNFSSAEAAKGAAK